MSPTFHEISESLLSLDDNELEELVKLIQLEKEDRLKTITDNALEELVRCINSIEDKYNVYFTYGWERIYPTEIECEFNE